MPRLKDQTSLPALEALFPDFVELSLQHSKLSQIASYLRKIAARCRQTRSITFYTTREIARFFGTSPGTARQAMAVVEEEGLLRRIRGSQTLLLGVDSIARSKVRAVVGFPLWVFAQRFSHNHASIAMNLGDKLWPHNIVLDLILHHDLGDRREELSARLARHGLDFALWLLPLKHHGEAMLNLQDRGVRNLVVGLDTGTSPFPLQITVEMIRAYEELLMFWRSEHDIKIIYVVNPREFPARNRIRFFAHLATAKGFDCRVVTSSHTLAGEIAKGHRCKVGVALLDEHATVEFSFYDPPGFVALGRRHRILFGNSNINLPFVPDQELTCERIYIYANKVMEAVTHALLTWSDGRKLDDDLRAPTKLDVYSKIRRYL